MLLGLVFPNNNANTTTNNDQNQVTIENVQINNSTNSEGDTGGQSQPIPPKK